MLLPFFVPTPGTTAMDNQGFAGGALPRSYGATSERLVPNVDFSSSLHTEFHSVGDSITTNIYTINSSIKQLDDAFKGFGTKRDSQGLRDKM